jgi:S1-C subfamily serine protease
MDLQPEEGVIVTQVRTGSPADRAEIHIGDVILKIRDQKIESFDSFEKISEQYRDSGKRIGLLVQRRTYTTFVYITPDK